ncbi:MAG: hypothetical protein AAF961_19590, partial [Planctomycetota bacterium]
MSRNTHEIARRRTLTYESLESRVVLSATATTLADAAAVTTPVRHVSEQVAAPGNRSVAALGHWHFSSLAAAEVPSPSVEQISMIPNVGSFGRWPASARAALTQDQVRSLDVAKIRLDLLSPQQISGLSTAQIRTLSIHELKHLTATQIPFVTAAQIAAIPDPGPIGEWSQPARAALTSYQVQALNVADVGLKWLVDQQIGWLTAAQIRSVGIHDMQYLLPGQ